MGEQDAKGMWDDLIRLLRNFVERLSQPIRRMLGRGGHYLLGKGTEKGKEFIDARKGSAAMDAVLKDGKYEKYAMSSYFDFENINKVIEEAKQRNVTICIEKLDPKDGTKNLSKKDMERLTKLHEKKKELSIEQSRLANRYAGKAEGNFHKKMKEVSEKLDAVENDIKTINAQNCLYTVYANIQHTDFIDAMDKYKLDPLQAEIKKKESQIADRTKMDRKDKEFEELVSSYQKDPNILVEFGSPTAPSDQLTADNFPGKAGAIINYGSIDRDAQLKGKTYLEVFVSKETYAKLRRDPDFKIPHEAKVFPLGDRVQLSCDSTYATGMLMNLDAIRDKNLDSFEVQFHTPDMLEDEKAYTEQQSGMSEFTMDMEPQALGHLEDFYNKVRTEWESTYIATRVLYNENDPTPKIVVKTNLSEDAIRDYLEVSKKNELTQVNEISMESEHSKIIQEYNMNDIDIDSYQEQYEKQIEAKKKTKKEEKHQNPPKPSKKTDRPHQKGSGFDRNPRPKRNKSSKDKGGR